MEVYIYDLTYNRSSKYSHQVIFHIAIENPRKKWSLSSLGSSLWTVVNFHEGTGRGAPVDVMFVDLQTTITIVVRCYKYHKPYLLKWCYWTLSFLLGPTICSFNISQDRIQWDPASPRRWPLQLWNPSRQTAFVDAGGGQVVTSPRDSHGWRPKGTCKSWTRVTNQ